VDGAGNVYVADSNNHAVKEIVAVGGSIPASNPTILTLGSGFIQPDGVAVDSAGNVYVADFATNFVSEIVAVRGIIPASNPTILTLGGGFSGPEGVAVDGAGNVYVADTNNSVVKEIVAVGGVIPASNPAILTLGSGFSGPEGMAVDGAGNVYVADTSNNAVKEIPVATPPSLSFATTSVGATSSPQTLLLQNIGNAALSFPVQNTGNNPSISANFVLGSGSTCPLVTTGSPGALAPGTCTDIISFAPTAIGSVSGALAFIDNSLSDGGNGMQSIPLSGMAVAALEATQAVASTLLTQNHTVTSFIPVTGSGGVGTLSYSVSPALPTGLNLSTSTGAITGTASVASMATNYTVTVMDANNATATAMFSLTVNTAVVATQAIASTALTQNHAATSFIPVTGSGGTPALSYSVSPMLPMGLTLSTSTGAITGTASGTRVATTYAVTVTDTNSATAIATFSLTVNAAVAATSAIPSTTLTENHAATPFTPVTATGGTDTLSYTVSPALPMGLNLSTSTGAITGTASVASAITNYTVTVTDTNLATTTATFSLTVNAAVVATQAVPTTTLTENHAATPFTPVTATGGMGTLSYTVLPTLPMGLTLAGSTGAITGTPTVTSSATNYTVTVTDTNGATSTVMFSLTVNAAVAATPAVGSTTLTENHMTTPFTPVTSSGGTGALSYSVSPALPMGLNLSTSTGAITGTASVASPATTYTVTVTDANSATATATFSLTVNTAVVATQAIASTMPTENHAAASFTPVTGANGTGTLTYSVSPALPMGLNLSTSTGAITGTASVASPATTYTVTVTDANSATATATFSLTVNTAVVATSAVASTTLTENHVATPFTPVTGSGGTGTLSYSVSPTLPMGLNFSTSTGAITGTASVASAITTYTVTDANNSTAIATFSLTVNAAVAATSAVSSTSLTVTQLATPFTPVTGLGGTGTLSYSVLPTLPMGLNLSTSTGAIAGTPTVTSSATTYTVTVMDANGATATATFSLAVNMATPAIVFTVPNHTFGDTPFAVSATSNSTGAFTYSVVSGLATISGSTVTLNGAGPVVLEASKAADADFVASSKNASFTVAAGTPTIVFMVPNHTLGDAPFAVSATSNSTGTFTYSVVSGPATISGSTVTLNGAGPVVLEASEAADANFAASSKNASFTVATGSPTIVFMLPNYTFGDAPFTVSATSNSTGVFTYSVVSGPATISGSTVTLTGVGAVVLSASEAADANFIASSKNASFTVAAATPVIAFVVQNQTFGDAPFAVSAGSNSTGAFTYSVVSGPATVSGSTVTLTGAGTVVLDASLAASGNYAAATATTSFTVAMGFSLGGGIGGGTGSSATTTPGGAASFNLVLNPGAGATFLDPIHFSTSGLPFGATASFSPAMIAAGSPATTVALSIQTSSNQARRNESPFSGKAIASVAMGFLLLPFLGLKPVRKRFRQMPHFSIAVAVVSLGALLMGLSGCAGGANNPPTIQPATNYTVVVTATDATTGVQRTTNLTLIVQ
jgi:hypothetical protein